MSQTLREEQDKAFQLALEKDREKVISNVTSSIAETILL